MKDRDPAQTSTEIANLLGALAALIEKRGLEEVVALLKQEASSLKVRASPSLLATVGPESSILRDIPQIAEALQKLRSRDEGLALLSSASLTRRDLEKLGRIIGIPILKTDNMERLTQRIIEASIGARLSSEAVRGTAPVR